LTEKKPPANPDHLNSFISHTKQLKYFGLYGSKNSCVE